MKDEPRNEEGKTEAELWASLEGQTGSDRVSTLLELCAMTTQRDEHEHALSLADTGIEEARTADNDQLVAHGLMMRGFVLRNLERFEESTASFLDAAHIYEQYDSALEISRAYFEASWSLEMAGILDRALTSADTAIAAAQGQDDELMLARAYVQRADVLKKLGGRDDEYLQTLSAARQGFRSASDVQGVLNMDDRAASVLADQGDYVGAVNLLSDCLAVAESLTEERAAYFAYRLGHAQRLKGDFTDALATLQRPLAYNLANDSIQPLAVTYFEMGMCEWRIGHEDEAFRYLTKARAHYDMVGLDHQVQDCDEQRSIWLHGATRYAEAAAVNRLLIEQCSGWMRFMARARLADNLRWMEDYDAALEQSTPEPELEAEFVGWGGWFWRECVRAMVLEALDRQDEAWDIAARCLEMDTTNASAFAQAKFHELRGDAKLSADEEDAAHADWARAVAFYLQADLPREAKRLSAAFLPTTREAAVQ